MRILRAIGFWAVTVGISLVGMVRLLEYGFERYIILATQRPAPV